MILNKKSIGRKLLYKVLLISTVVTTVFTMINVFYDYNQQIKKLNKALDYIETSTLESIGLAIWNYDQDQIRNVINGLAKIDDIIDISVYSENKEVFYSSGSSNNKDRFLLTREYNLEVQSNGITKNVGSLVVVFTKKNIFIELFKKSMVFFISQILKTLLLSLFILLIFYRLIGEPLLEITKKLLGTKSNMIDKIDSKIWKAHPGSELEHLGESINALLEMVGRNDKSNIDQLLQSQNFLKNAQMISKLGSWHFDVNSGVIRWTDQMFELFSENIEDGAPSFEKHRLSIYKDDLDLWDRTITEAIRDAKSYNMVFRTQKPDGEIIWLRAFGNPHISSNGEVIAIEGTCQDITNEMQKKLILKAVYNIRKIYQISENSKNEFYNKTLEHLLRITNSNKAFIYKLDTINGSYILNNIVGYSIFDKELNLINMTENTTFMGIELFNIESNLKKLKNENNFIILNKSKGNLKIVSPIDSQETVDNVLIIPIFIKDNLVAFYGLSGREKRYDSKMVELLQPITNLLIDIFILLDQEEYENKIKGDLEQQQMFISNTLENLPIGFYANDTDSKIILANDYIKKIFSIESTDLSGLIDTTVFPSGFLKNINKSKKTTAKDSLTDNEVQIELPDGSHCCILALRFPYINSSGEVYAQGNVVIDITDKKNIEAQLNHKSRLASIGELAAGVGHEINNPLAIATGYLSTLQKKITSNSSIKSDDMMTYIKKIKIANARIAKIVMGLKNFSRSDNDDNFKFSATESLSESVGLVEEIYKKNGIKITIEIADECKNILLLGDRNKIQQVYMNLLTNAKDALADTENGKISIKSTIVDNQIELCFSDNGCGISNNLKNRIFDPFFTTKEVNVGTGIGLSMVFNIVREFKGSIDLDNSIRGNTTFRIKLPFYNKVDEPPSSNPTNSNSRPLISCNVLIVDDEEGIRDILNDILTDMGMTVFQANNGRDAYDLFLKDQKKYELIISDVQMPVMDGPSLLREIRLNKEIKTQPKFIFCTGGVNVVFENENSELGELIDGYFFKPLNEDIIYKTILDVIASGSLSKAS